MRSFSSNYCSENNNYIININLPNKNIKKDLYSTYCVIQNILQRGKVSKPSNFLLEKLGKYEIDRNIRYCSIKETDWRLTIKGNDKTNYNPALIFFNEILKKELKDLSFIRNLIIPEIEINDITGEENKDFKNNRVDFYLPQCNLVIEIDGIQHESEINKLTDLERDNYLKKFNTDILRITTKEIKDYLNNNIKSLCEKISYIYDKCKRNTEIINNKNFIDNIDLSQNKSSIYDSILRFQMLILELLKNGVLSINSKKWTLNILNHDIEFPYELAIEDLFKWIKHIFNLQEKKLNEIDIDINKVYSFEDSNDGINIDFSLLKRWDDNCYDENICYVRSDYLYNRNYFKVQTAELIRYRIIPYGEKGSNIHSLKYILENIFGFNNFNNGQLSIIANALMLNDTIGLLPTGGGKSLCYQLCCMLQPTINFIVVPIKSLMYDQYKNVKNKGIYYCNFISSDQDGEEKEKILYDFSNLKYFYLWISPERFQTESFRTQLQKINRFSNIGYAVIDEVHCMSEWGHDFRTSYLNLIKTIRNNCPTAIFLGLTATASKNVLKDIQVELEIDDKNIKTIVDYTRKELAFKVIQDDKNYKYDKSENLLMLLNELNKQENVFEINGDQSKCGIIFTPYVNGDYGCYDLCQKLNSIDYINEKVDFYSGQAPKYAPSIIRSEKSFNLYKQEVQEKFKENKLMLLVATKAFGMGVDKPNVRYTVHYGIPGSIESLYQEAGRAGRDGKEAKCFILNSKSNIDQKDYDMLFDLNTSIEDLNEIQKKYRNFSDDIFRNLFLSLQNNRGVNEEAAFTYGLYKSFCINKKTIISVEEVRSVGIRNNGRLIDCNFGVVQKAIYRLSLLGVINDWTVEGWNSRGKFKIYYGNINAKSIENNIETYIKKYDKEFSIANLNLARYKKYNDIYEDDNDKIFLLIKLLVQWNYDNVFYSRRESQKNLVNLCDSYFKKGEKYFKQQLENYFKITEDTLVLDYIANNPNDFNAIRNLILTDDNSDIKEENIVKLKSGLARYLESYRYNTALNILSGLFGLITNEFDNVTKSRFIESFKVINEKDDKYKEELLSISLDVGQFLDKKERNILGDILNIYYEDNYRIYEKIRDDISLNNILEKNITKLCRIGESLNG